MNIAGAGKRLMQRYLRTESDDRYMDFSFTVLGVAEGIQHIANGIIHIADFLSAHAAAHIEKKHDGYPTPSRTMMRVSFIPMEPPITQADVRQEVQANKQQVLKDLADTWREEAPMMWAGLAKNGVKEVGRASIAVEPLGGQLALIIRYARTSTANPAETMRVTQYHVPLGAEKALITLSYIEGDQKAMAAHNRLKSSIAIR